MSWINSHTPPDRAALARNRDVEPEGERLREELEEWMARNKIVAILLDTDHHSVEVNIDHLPPRTKTVLTTWGAITVEVNPETGNYEPELKWNERCSALLKRALKERAAPPDQAPSPWKSIPGVVINIYD